MKIDVRSCAYHAMLSGMHDWEAVEAEAERIAPYPKIEPALGGGVALAASLVALDLFSFLAGIDLEGRAWLAALAVSACVAGGVFVYFNNQKRRHFSEWSRLDKRARERNA